MITAKKFNFILSGILIILIGSGIALTVFANKWLTGKAQNLVSLKLDTASLEEKQGINQKSATELQKYKNVADILEKIVPKSKDQAKAIAELIAIAKERGFDINSFTFPASDLGGITSAPVAGTTAQTSPQATSAVSQAKPVEGIPGVLGIEVTLASFEDFSGAVASNITYDQLIGFLEAVEKNRRTMQIKKLVINPVVTPGNSTVSYTLNLTMNLFVKP